jgi:nucleotide-binding universal stress UspA family protein
MVPARFVMTDARIVIVAGVDLSSPLAEHVIVSARKLTRMASESELHLLHVLRPLSIPPDVLWMAVVPKDETREAIISRTHAELEDACARSIGVEHPGLRLHVRVGDVAAELRALADEVGADYIVVGTVGRRGLSRLLHGSAATRLLRSAPCSTVVVRPECEVSVEPPCHDCVEARFWSRGTQQWCARHSEHHVHAHTYHGGPPSSDGSSAFRFHG